MLHVPMIGNWWGFDLTSGIFIPHYNSFLCLLTHQTLNKNLCSARYHGRQGDTARKRHYLCSQGVYIPLEGKTANKPRNTIWSQVKKTWSMIGDREWQEREGWGASLGRWHLRSHLNEVRESVRQRSAEGVLSSREDRKCQGPETY